MAYNPARAPCRKTGDFGDTIQTESWAAGWCNPGHEEPTALMEARATMTAKDALPLVLQNKANVHHHSPLARAQNGPGGGGGEQ